MFEKRSIYSLAAEFLLIISGILISLFFQGKFEARQQREEGLQILNQVFNDLKLDTALFTANVNSATYLMDQYTWLLKAGSRNITAADMPAVVEGVLATDTKILTILNQGGYLRFSSFGNYELYDRPDLINAILHYYNNQNELLSNLYHWDADYVENRIVGFYVSHHTGNLRRYFEQSILGDNSRPEDIVMMQSMLRDPEFQSLQAYNFIIKQNYKAQLEAARKEAVILMEKLEEYRRE